MMFGGFSLHNTRQNVLSFKKSRAEYLHSQIDNIMIHSMPKYMYTQ
jgi:hypothetical protein